MSDNLKTAMAISATGMRAQGFRLKIVAQNIANVSTTADRTGVILIDARSLRLRTF